MYEQKFEDTKEVIKNCQSKKNIQYNGLKYKKAYRTLPKTKDQATQGPGGSMS